MRFKRKTEKNKVITRINEIRKIQSELNKELEELREKCPHENRKIGYLMLQNGSYDISEICIDCGKILGPITEISMRNI